MEKNRVTFQNVQESYELNQDIIVEFVISEGHPVHCRDWIGLFKVGWTLYSNFYSYQWVPYPSGYVEGSELSNKVVFPASQLPSNDGCFYQFCYMSNNGKMVGVSSSFQFQEEIIEDFLEVDSEDGLIVKTKTMLLENMLEGSQKNNASLKLKLKEMEEECKRLRVQRDAMEEQVMECMKKMDNIEEYDKKYSENCKHIDQLEEEINALKKENTSCKSSMITSNDKMVLIMEKYKDQQTVLEHLNKSNNDLHKRNEKLEKEVSRLMELSNGQTKEIKTLKKQRDIANSQIEAAELTKNLLKQEFEKELIKMEALAIENINLRKELQFFESTSDSGKSRIDIHVKAKSKTEDKSFFDIFKNIGN